MSASNSCDHITSHQFENRMLETDRRAIHSNDDRAIMEAGCATRSPLDPYFFIVTHCHCIELVSLVGGLER
eukprot:scaffold26620_cov160-Skeletonema_menzelii.AAC.6